MSDGARPSETAAVPSSRPIIPTLTTHPSVRTDPLPEGDSLLKHYYNSYLRLCKEGTVLVNQINIISSETKELKDKLEVLKVVPLLVRSSRKRKENGIGGPPTRSSGTSTAQCTSAGRATGPRPRCCST